MSFCSQASRSDKLSFSGSLHFHFLLMCIICKAVIFLYYENGK